MQRKNMKKICQCKTDRNDKIKETFKEFWAREYEYMKTK